MENAVKALTMAGGILIAIMVLATLLYAATTWGIIPTAKDETDAAKQLAEFNQQYESYARKALYGTDLVSVLNKAIDNNKKYNANTTRDNMFINIHFTLINDVREIERTYRVYYSSAGKAEEPILVNETMGKIILNATEDYNLGASNVKDIKAFLDKFSEDNDQGSTTFREYNSRYGVDEAGKRYKEYTVKIPDVSDFKTRIFVCEDIIDTSEDGRIHYMVFNEIETKKQE